MFKHLAIITLGAGLLATVPQAVLAQDEHRDEQRRDRVYDRDHKDYHEWNEAEQRAWRRYWEEQHRDFVDWQRASEEQQRAYWRWRHEHPDGDRR
jgi:hypothetical protein